MAVVQNSPAPRVLHDKSVASAAYCTAPADTDWKVGFILATLESDPFELFDSSYYAGRAAGRDNAHSTAGPAGFF